MVTDANFGVDDHLPALPEVVKRFLARSVLLYGIPFSYIVPDARMLPPESIRFFYIDPGWLMTMAQGATSVGRTNAKDSTLDTYLRYEALNDALTDAASVRESGAASNEPKAVKADWPLTGFLIHSEVVAGWQGVEMHAMDVSGAELAPLRIDRLAPGIMLCIFNGKVETLTVKQPPEGMHFGLSPDVDGGYRRLKLRNLNGEMHVTSLEGPLTISSSNPQSKAKFVYSDDAAWSDGTSLSEAQIEALKVGFTVSPMGWDYVVDNAQMGFLINTSASVTLSFRVTVTYQDDTSKDETIGLTLSPADGGLQIQSSPASPNPSSSQSVAPGEFFPACFKTGLMAPLRTAVGARTRPTRVVRVADLANDIKDELIRHDQKVDAFTSAEFGVEMVESPGYVTFNSKKSE